MNKKESETNSLSKKLTTKSSFFNFYQAYRLLARQYGESNCNGHQSPTINNKIKLTSTATLKFMGSSVDSIQLPKHDEIGHLAITFMGLAGHGGPLPSHYTELLQRQRQKRDFALEEFLNIFNQRLITLFYAAWEKSQFALQFERRQEDLLTQSLYSLMGLGSQKLRRKLQFRTEHLLPYAADIAKGPVSAAILQRILKSYLKDIAITIHPFQGQWLDLDQASLTCLGPDENAALGYSSVLGRRIWDVQSHISLTLGPLKWHQFLTLLPGGKLEIQLKALTHFLCGGQVSIRLILQLAKGEGQATQLANPAHQLARSSWLQGDLNPNNQQSIAPNPI